MKRLLPNTVFSFLLHIVTILSGLVLPRMILQYYGSETNGLVTSVAQFLQVIALLELGVGAVVQSALYKPLGAKDSNRVSQIVTSADRFFRRIGIILLVYVIVLVCFYPYFVEKEVDHVFTALLIIAMSINYFAEYYFGIVDQLLLAADQHGYIFCLSKIVAIVFNTVISMVIIWLHGSIQLVKFIASAVFVARTLIIRYYVQSHYRLNRKSKYTGEPIKQKWNGMAQSISGMIVENTDIIVLTTFSTLQNVSIYSVYHLVINGVKALLLSLTGGLAPLLGNLYSQNKMKDLEKAFGWSEWILHNAVTIIFSCTSILILPFIRVYISDVSDAEAYLQPVFAGLLTLAHAIHSLHYPYHMMVKAAGKFKETQNSYFIAAVINISMSVIMVNCFGLIGVAFGTLLAMAFHTVYLSLFCIRKLSLGSPKELGRLLFSDILIAFLSVSLNRWASQSVPDLLNWFINAIGVFLICLIIAGGINAIFYRTRVLALVNKLRNAKSKLT